MREVIETIVVLFDGAQYALGALVACLFFIARLPKKGVSTNRLIHSIFLSILFLCTVSYFVIQDTKLLPYSILINGIAAGSVIGLVVWESIQVDIREAVITSIGAVAYSLVGMSLTGKVLTFFSYNATGLTAWKENTAIAASVYLIITFILFLVMILPMGREIPEKINYELTGFSLAFIGIGLYLSYSQTHIDSNFTLYSFSPVLMWNFTWIQVVLFGIAFIFIWVQFLQAGKKRKETLDVAYNQWGE